MAREALPTETGSQQLGHPYGVPRLPSTLRLYEDVDQVTVLVHRAPEILALTVDRDEDLVQEPRV